LSWRFRLFFFFVVFPVLRGAMVNIQDLQVLLAESLQDFVMTRAEKGRLRAALHTLQPDQRILNVLRGKAFELSRAAIESAPDQTVSIVDWLEAVAGLLQPGQTTDQEVCEAWFSPQDNCPARIRSLLGGASKSADLCVFTITDDRLTSAILEAHQRGVAVRILTDNDKSLDPGSDADRLRHAGIELRMDRSRFHMHHKFAIFDGTLLLNGSYNWTRGAADENEENFIVTSEMRLLRAFSRTFEALWEQVLRT
jgi:mitochondrial cardiolipin hydrolase